ncbi:MAG: xanthine dehydrogenase family protein molybdopterin-binding subunit [Deltaproteobacteria bacterium]|nr:xanthine dehydrogenase family protein molybdopterin-binding subunit [Deltaproteobacteria bacterium]
MPPEIPKTLAGLPTSAPRFVGKPTARIEDPALVSGRVEFIDNLALPGMLHCAILRSPVAHARITRIDVRGAEAMPGVFAVLTGEDARRTTAPLATIPEGWGVHCLAAGKVRFVGEPVAAVAATTRYLAEDALERIEVEYEPLDPIVDAVEAMKPGAPLILEEKGTNVVLQKKFVWGDVAGAFRSADRVFTERFRWNRLGANPMETFGVVAQWDPVDGTLTCRGSYQTQGYMALAVATVLQVSAHRVRVVSHPHGGSFGGKGGTRGTCIAALLSRKAGGRPVKWIEDRMEYLVGGAGQAWDRHYEASLAVKADGTLTGLRVRLIDDLGGTPEGAGAISAAKPLTSFTGCYTIGAAEYDLTLVLTNKLPTGPYRGMGPPPHNWVVEQMVDIAARDLGIDPGEIRRRNFIPKDAFPYEIVTGNEYDSGDYAAALDRVIEMSEYRRLREEQERARAQGRLVGLGLVSTIEPGVFDWNAYAIVGVPMTGVPEGATVSIDLFGKIVAKVGFSLEGQGQYTVAAQVLADYFGVEMSDVRIVAQDSLAAPPHFGPGGSRLGVALTGAILGAAERVKAKLVRVAAHLMQADPSAVELMDGKLRLRGVAGAEMPVAQVAAVMLTRSDLLPPDVEPSPEATYVWTAPGRTPADENGRAKSYLTAANACHLVRVEIDPDTAQVRIDGYWIADDCGVRLNPANVEGMIRGGVAQGVGAALLEEYVYDAEGQALTSTFMDYLLPSIHDVPQAQMATLVTPSPFTPLGAKGVGEGAIHTTPAAILCAINDALAPLGVRATESPASPQRLWTLLQNAKPGR